MGVPKEMKSLRNKYTMPNDEKNKGRRVDVGYRTRRISMEVHWSTVRKSSFSTTYQAEVKKRDKVQAMVHARILKATFGFLLNGRVKRNGRHLLLSGSS